MDGAGVRERAGVPVFCEPSGTDAGSAWRPPSPVADSDGPRLQIRAVESTPGPPFEESRP